MSEKILWKPSEEFIRDSNMNKFIQYLQKNKGLAFDTYKELYTWSVYNRKDFWAAVWEFSEMKYSKNYDVILENGDDMLRSRWFVGARMNFAENLLRHRDDSTAIIFKSEVIDLPTRKMSYAEMYSNVARLARSLRQSGLSSGERVAAFMPNIPETIVAMLAATSIGAVWSSCAADFGLNSVIARFRQIKPTVLFVSDGYSSNGKRFDTLNMVPRILEEIPSIKRVIVVPYIHVASEIVLDEAMTLYDDFLSKDTTPEIKFEQLPFDHPVYIVYTSGTTGMPKCVVHGAGGTLLQHFKELSLHSDLKRESKLFYVTTCGWVLWNWMTGSLMLGSTLILRDGSSFFPTPDALFQFIDEQKVTHFGTSARHIISTEKLGMKPREKYNFDALKVFMYGGSALFEEGHEFIYREIKSDIMLSSMPGGTEILSCFALANPLSPVYAGEVQGFGLGMKCHVFDENGNPVIGKKGELVCAASFPSQPLYFWDDPLLEKYKEAYFTIYHNVWRHGDFAEVTPRGSVVVYGRSDATLNPGGVRIGTSEIYRQLETIPEIEDSVVVGQDWNNDQRIILFIKMVEGATFSDELAKKIKTLIRTNCTPNYVPAKIIPVKDIPYTINNKKVEMAVKRVIENKSVLNRGALSNPESLELYKNLPELQY